MIYELESMTENDVHAVNLSCARSYVYYHESKYYSSIFDEMFVQTVLKWKYILSKIIRIDKPHPQQKVGDS